MSAIKSYKDLLIWQKGIDIVVNIYELVEGFPKEELYALTGQLKRASVSIPSNIAEGYGRNSTQSYISFINISRGSLFEIETQLIIAKRLKFVKNESLYEEVMIQILEETKMINSFINKLENSKN
ncbi:MAG: four helix bundle protein [Flavobacteriaceae bacterium]|jgi:four helix bundle protein|nr:four helix bundle protein [Flavobacteriaceae bacterium]